MDRRTSTFRIVLFAVAWVYLFAPATTAQAASGTTYSKVVVIQLQGASNSDTVAVGPDNATVKFDSALNYYATSDTFKVSLKTTAIKEGTYDVYLKAILFNDNGTTATHYHLAYDNSTTTGFRVIKLENKETAILEDVAKSVTLDVLSFPLDKETESKQPILLQAIAKKGDSVIGMDTKVLFFNWLDGQQPSSGP